MTLWIFSTHQVDLVAIEMADFVYVMDRGQIVASRDGSRRSSTARRCWPKPGFDVAGHKPKLIRSLQENGVAIRYGLHLREDAQKSFLDAYTRRT